MKKRTYNDLTDYLDALDDAVAKRDNLIAEREAGRLRLDEIKAEYPNAENTPSSINHEFDDLTERVIRLDRDIPEANRKINALAGELWGLTWRTIGINISVMVRGPEGLRKFLEAAQKASEVPVRVSSDVQDGAGVYV